MKYLLLLCALLIIMAGCSYAPSVPENYAGPLASVKDTVKKKGPTRANIYYLESIDGNRIYNSNISTMENSAGKGIYADLKPNVIERDIPARKSSVALVGIRQYVSGVEALTSDNYYVTGEVNFNPEEGKRYVVNGNLADEYSSVWIEEEMTGIKVTDVIKSNEDKYKKKKKNISVKEAWGQKNTENQ